MLEELSDALAGDDRALAALENLRVIARHLLEMGVSPEQFAIAPGLARGLSYYTGTVFESVIENPPMGSLLARGERFGLIRFGSRTDVYLPVDAATPAVAPGDRVLGGETVIAHWTT